MIPFSFLIYFGPILNMFRSYSCFFMQELLLEVLKGLSRMAGNKHWLVICKVSVLSSVLSLWHQDHDFWCWFFLFNCVALDKSLNFQILFFCIIEIIYTYICYLSLIILITGMSEKWFNVTITRKTTFLSAIIGHLTKQKRSS